MPGKRIIGVDEAGKGDFFGSLVIAAFLASDDDLNALDDIGVRDSKKIAPKRLLTIDERLRALYPHVLVIIPPPEYNRRWKESRNLNKLLAEGHAEAIDRLRQQHPADIAVCDKFGKPELIEDELVSLGCSLDVDQIERGESVAQVGAASILARAGFVREMERLSESIGFELPKGAAPIVDQAGRKLVQQQGEEVLERVAKVHFKNYQRVTDRRLFA
ncbi:ribonuclease HIII [candidate division GN15 bacterium]|nr:ribonuclease HIII [candidate division GN15 bacterium]